VFPRELIEHQLSDLETPAHLVEFFAGIQLLLALVELADDLIRRVPPAPSGCHVAALPSALTGETVVQHPDH